MAELFSRRDPKITNLEDWEKADKEAADTFIRLARDVKPSNAYGPHTVAFIGDCNTGIRSLSLSLSLSLNTYTHIASCNGMHWNHSMTCNGIHNQ